MKIIVVCEHTRHLSNIYASLGTIEAAPVVLHANDCGSAIRTLTSHDDISLVLVDSDLASGPQAEHFHRLRTLQPSTPFLMVSDTTDGRHIRAAVEEVRSRTILDSAVGQAFLKSLIARVSHDAVPAQTHAPASIVGPQPRELDCEPLAEANEPAAASLQGTAPRSTACDALTGRQREVLTLMCDGKSNKEIGNVLDISEGTVKVHCRAIFRELGVRNRMAAAARVVQGATQTL